MLQKSTVLHLFLLSTLILAISAAAWADPKVQVSFPEKGGYLYWLEYKGADGKQAITAPKHAAGSRTSVDLAPAAPGGKLGEGTLKVYDEKSGNVAAKNIQNLQGKTDLKLKTNDFTLIRTLKIVLKPADGKDNERIESAIVTLTDANSDTFTMLVDPASEGVAEFHDVAGGAVSVIVQSEGKKMSLDLDMPLERDTPVHTEDLTVSFKTRTVEASVAAASKASSDSEKSEKKPAASKEQKAQPGTSILQYIMGIAVIAMLGFIGYVVLKSRGLNADSLRKLGVQLPQGDDTAVNVPGTAQEPQADPNVCPFCGQRKDPVTGNCACSVGSPSAGQAPSATAGVPRLIGTQGQYSGHIFEITGAEATIGRDPGNTIPLVEDSTSSRRHARFGQENGAYFVMDEGSSNGTFVNGMKITGRHPIHTGDEVQIGGTKFRFEA
ncbi:MAG: FHA domain-containing protein [Armatimonadota bacterium]